MYKLSLVNSDKYYCISTLTYLFELEPKLLLPNELDDILLSTYQSLKEIGLTAPLSNIIGLLNSIDTKQLIVLDDEFKISPRNRWFCKFVILAGLKHCKTLFMDDQENDITAIRGAILQQSLITFHPDRIESIHLLRLVAKLADFLGYKSDSTIAINLINFAQLAALSPLNGFKQYAENISEKAIIHATTIQQTKFINVDFLPLRGISTSKLGQYFPRLLISDPLFQTIVTKIIEMFSNNIENREGSFLYRVLLEVLKDDFDSWRLAVWPQFYNKFEVMDCEGEFFQSLLKYWIPQTVGLYQSKFYDFMSATSVPDLLKGYILLETRKKHLMNTYNEGQLRALFSQEKTRELAFQIVCCPSKKKMLPTISELYFIRTFLYEQGDTLNREEVQALQKFFTHLGTLMGDIQVEDEYFKYLKRYIDYSSSLLKTHRKPLGAQILMALWSGMIIRENLEDDGFPFLRHLESEAFADSIEEMLFYSNGLYPEISDLATKVVKVPKILTNEFLLSFIDKASSDLSIKASDSVKTIARFVAMVSAKHNNLVKSIYNTVMTLFESDLPQSMRPKDIFKAVLLLEALNEVSKYVSYEDEILEGIHTVCFPMVVQMLAQKNYQYNQDSSLTLEERLNVKHKFEKILEALYINLCDCLLKNTNIRKGLDQPKLINELVLVIEHSSMRRPTTVSADLLKRLATITEAKVRENVKSNQEQRELQKTLNEETKNQQRLASFRVKLLDRTLQKLSQVAPVQNLTIRRNPETRLVLHALCVSDFSPQKQFLTWTLTHLLNLLTNKTSTNATRSAALHCTEIFMSDNTLYNHTLKYAPEVILACVHHFENRNWIVRNACVQLVKALIDRFLGVLIGPNTRPRSVDDLFQLFPQIALPFFVTLTKKPLNDSALVVMQFFLESQLKAQPYSSTISLVTREAFLKVFVELIKDDSGLYGLFAARAYVSLCLEQQIPSIVRHIVDFLIENFKYIRTKHTIRNFMLLLQELYDKFLNFILNKPAKPTGLFEILQSLNDLSTFLSHCNSKQLDCLLVKVNSVDNALEKFDHVDFSNIDFNNRMWLHNYLPFLVINASLNDLPHILNVLLAKGVPECLHIKVLSIVVDRFTRKRQLHDKVNEIVSVLVCKALEIENTKTYLLICYFKVIHLLFENLDFACKDLEVKIRQHYNEAPCNIYKIFIIILIMSTTESESNKDKAFAKLAIKQFQHLDFADEDFVEDASEMLKFLYKNSYCVCDRKRVLKLALLFLVKHGFWHFISFITKSNIPTPIQAMKKVLNFHFLRTFFNSDNQAFEFVKEFYSVVCVDNRLVTHKSETFYVPTDEVFVDTDCIGRFVVKFLYELCNSKKMHDWHEFYKKVRNKNKVIL